MNKLTMVLGVAAVATLAGCKDASYKYANTGSQNEVKNVDTAPVEVKPIETVEKKCQCAPGTKHYSPCQCDAPDCQCVVEVKPIAPVAPVTTTYIVQNGDYLAKISKRFNVTINAIKKANPGIKKDVVRVGQKLQIPGKHEISAAEQKNDGAKRVNAQKKQSAPYSGATKDYVVKAGDTLGGIAYGNGINIRQLKELNKLSNDRLKVGQKLKVPADGKAVAAAPAPVKAEPKKASAPVAPASAPEAAPAPVAPAPAPEAATAAPEAAPAAPQTAPAPVEPETSTYVVQEGDDMTGVSIRWGVSAAAIRDLNNLPDDAQLTPGQVIKLPADAQQ